MVIVEALAIALVLALAVTATIAMYVGLLGTFGAVRFVRCGHCGHLTMTSASEPPLSCTYCRHDRLRHPVEAVLHTHGLHLARHEAVKH